MIARLLAHLRQQWMGAIALLLVLTGGTAYALDGSNTGFTDDIVNGEVKEADVGQGAVATDELANNQVKASDIGDGEVKSAEVANGQVKTADIGAGEVESANVLDDNLTGGDVAANSLKGADIDEATLSGFGGAQLIVRDGAMASIDPGEGMFLTSECEAGERATGGGVKFLSPLVTDRVGNVMPTDESGTWHRTWRLRRVGAAGSSTVRTSRATPTRWRSAPTLHSSVRVRMATSSRVGGKRALGAARGRATR